MIEQYYIIWWLDRCNLVDEDTLAIVSHVSGESHDNTCHHHDTTYRSHWDLLSSLGCPIGPGSGMIVYAPNLWRTIFLDSLLNTEPLDWWGPCFAVTSASVIGGPMVPPATSSWVLLCTACRMWGLADLDSLSSRSFSMLRRLGADLRNSSKFGNGVI